MKYKEGDTVSCYASVKIEDEKELKTGTIWLLTSSRIIILDTQGYLHNCSHNEVFDVQA